MQKTFLQICKMCAKYSVLTYTFKVIQPAFINANRKIDIEMYIQDYAI